QTERDKARVIEGLLGTDGSGMDRGELERLLANLSARVFLMRNVHDDAPALFRTRWAMSYLRGPLTLAEIAQLQHGAGSAPPAPHPAPHPGPSAATSSSASSVKPVIPAEINEYYLGAGTDDALLLPRVLAKVRLHFVDRASGIDTW